MLAGKEIANNCNPFQMIEVSFSREKNVNLAAIHPFLSGALFKADTADVLRPSFRV